MTDYTSETDILGSRQFHPSYVIAGELACGAVAGALGIIVGVPFDFVKVRMQTYSHLYKSSWHCFTSSIKADGFLGLYRGCSAPVAAQGGVNALLFAGESMAMRYLQPELKRGEMATPWNSFLAGSFGGLLQCLLMVPADVIKCNMQIGTIVNGGSNSSKYSGVVDCCRQLYRNEGIAGFYRGFFVSSMREVPSIGVYFGAYRHSKDFLIQQGFHPTTTVPLVAGAIAGSVSWAVIYPIDVIKSNMQIDTGEKRPQTTLGMGKHLYNKHGAGIFFKGFSTTVIRAIPVNATTFYFYELFKKQLGLW